MKVKELIEALKLENPESEVEVDLYKLSDENEFIESVESNSPNIVTLMRETS